MTSITSFLACSELIGTVLRELRPVYLSEEAAVAYEASADTRRQARRDLVSSARVCKSFSEHALDGLWEVLEDLKPLLIALPSGYQNDLLHQDNLPLTISHDCNRLLSYTKRVKELRYVSFDKKDVNTFLCKMWPLLKAQCGVDTILFPNLQRLQALSLDISTTQYTTSHCLSSILKSLTVSFFTRYGRIIPNRRDGDRSDFHLLLSTLYRKCSISLTDLHIMRPHDLDRTTFCLEEQDIQTLAEFPHLQRFVSELELDATAWSQLNSLPSVLRHLDIVVTGPSGPYHSEFSLDFLHLQYLRLEGPLYVLVLLLDKLKSPNLRSVSFVLHDIPLSTSTEALNSLRAFLDLVRDRIPHALRKLAIRCLPPLGPPQPLHQDEIRLDLDPLLPSLGPFTQLDDLSIDLDDISVNVSDHGISILSSTFPNLVSLILRYSPRSLIPSPHESSGQDGRPTVGSLIALAENCPRLTRLHLADINIDVDIGATIAAFTTVNHRNLRELEISYLRTRSPSENGVFDFAQKIDLLFPHLVNIRSIHSDYSVSVSLYHSVQLCDILKSCLGFIRHLRNNGRQTRPTESEWQ